MEIVESDVSMPAERTEILRIPLVRQKKALALSQGSCQSSTESEGDNSSDDSYSPELETLAQRRKPSPKKKDDPDCSGDKTISPKPRTPRKKIEKVNYLMNLSSVNYFLILNILGSTISGGHRG